MTEINYKALHIKPSLKYKCKVHGFHQGYIYYVSDWDINNCDKGIKICDKCYFDFIAKNCCHLEEVKDEI